MLGIGLKSLPFEILKKAVDGRPAGVNGLRKRRDSSSIADLTGALHVSCECIEPLFIGVDLIFDPRGFPLDRSQNAGAFRQQFGTATAQFLFVDLFRFPFGRGTAIGPRIGRCLFLPAAFFQETLVAAVEDLDAF